MLYKVIDIKADEFFDLEKSECKQDKCRRGNRPYRRTLLPTVSTTNATIRSSVTQNGDILLRNLRIIRAEVNQPTCDVETTPNVRIVF